MGKNQEPEDKKKLAEVLKSFHVEARKKMAFLTSGAFVVMRLSFVVVRYFCKTMYNKQFLDSVFVISKTIEVSVSVISLSLSASADNAYLDLDCTE